jgi:hypothetical protein
VPRPKDKILSNYEKMNIINPQRELAQLSKVTKKSIATQTIDLVKVRAFEMVHFKLIWYFYIHFSTLQASIFGVETNEIVLDNAHPYFESVKKSATTNASPSKSAASNLLPVRQIRVPSNF